MIKSFRLKIKNYVLKLQSLPEDKKKIIFFAIMIVSFLIVGFFGVISTKKNISKIGESVKSINFPKIDLSGNSGETLTNDIDFNSIISNVSESNQNVFQ